MFKTKIAFRRPTGLTPEEQTKYLRIHYLRKKIAFVENAIAAQKKSFDVSIGLVVVNFKRFF